MERHKQSARARERARARAMCPEFRCDCWRVFSPEGFDVRAKWLHYGMLMMRFKAIGFDDFSQWGPLACVSIGMDI